MIQTSIRKLSVVVACFNEAANLRRFPQEVLPALRSWGGDFEIVLVDDGSTDDTPRVMHEIEILHENIHVLSHKSNLGLGAAIRTGLEKASGDAILTMDADLTFHPRDWPVMFGAYAQGVDCVMGSPFMGIMQGVPLSRRFLSWGVNMLYRVLLGINVSSTSSIFRLYRASLLKNLELSCTSFDINAEILFRMIAAGGVVKEVPVTLGTRIHGESKINTLREIKNHFKMLWGIIQWKANTPK